MRPVTVAEGEGGGEVLGHGWASSLDGTNDGLVQSLLVSDLGFRVGGLVGWVGKEGGLGLGTRSLFLSEVRVVELLVDLERRGEEEEKMCERAVHSICAEIDACSSFSLALPIRPVVALRLSQLGNPSLLRPLSISVLL